MSNFQIIKDEYGQRTVRLFLNGDILQADENNGNFDVIVQRLLADDLDGIENLFSIEKSVSLAFATLSSDVKIEDGVVFFRDKRVNDVLSEHLVRLWEAGEGYAPVVRFLEKLYQNPNENSVERLWNWISTRHLTLSETGNIIGYKGLRSDFRSLHAGKDDIRNGEPVNGHVLNKPGDVIEKDRSKVVFDVNIGCAEGLHVGDYSYASGFGSVVVQVEVNPADVVSVPNDDERKMRVCRYRVLEEVEREAEDYYQDTGYWDDDDEYDDEYDEEEDLFWDDEGELDELVDDHYSDSVPNPIKVKVTALDLKEKLDELIKQVNKPTAYYTVNNQFDGGLVGDPDKQAKKVLDVLKKSKGFNIKLTDKNLPADTRLNHLNQERDENGKFKKKGS